MYSKRLTDKQAITAYMETMGTCPSCKEDYISMGIPLTWESCMKTTNI